MPTAVRARSKGAKTGALVAAGITISHPDRVISETDHITKGELAEYHAAVAPFMLLHISRHPLSLLRCPSGIDGKQCFFQRSPGKGLGKDVHSFDFQNKGKHYEYAKMRNLSLHAPSDGSAARTRREHEQAIEHIKEMTSASVVASSSLRVSELRSESRRRRSKT